MALHRHLNNPTQWPQPFEHYIGRLCEEFQCLPTDAWREVQRLPAGFLETIVMFRRYAEAYHIFEQSPKELPEMAYMDDVITHAHQLVEEEIRERDG